MYVLLSTSASVDSSYGGRIPIRTHLTMPCFGQDATRAVGLRTGLQLPPFVGIETRGAVVQEEGAEHFSDLTAQQHSLLQLHFSAIKSGASDSQQSQVFCAQSRSYPFFASPVNELNGQIFNEIVKSSYTS